MGERMVQQANRLQSPRTLGGVIVTVIQWFNAN